MTPTVSITSLRRAQVPRAKAHQRSHPKVILCHKLIPFPILQSSIRALPSQSPNLKRTASSAHRSVWSPKAEVLSKAPASQIMLSTKTAPFHKTLGSSSPAEHSGQSKKSPAPRVVAVYLMSMPPFFQSQTTSATSVYPAVPSPPVIDSAASRATRQSTLSMSP